MDYSTFESVIDPGIRSRAVYCISRKTANKDTRGRFRETCGEEIIERHLASKMTNQGQRRFKGRDIGKVVETESIHFRRFRLRARRSAKSSIISTAGRKGILHQVGKHRTRTIEHSVLKDRNRFPSRGTRIGQGTSLTVIITRINFRK